MPGRGPGSGLLLAVGCCISRSPAPLPAARTQALMPSPVCTLPGRWMPGLGRTYLPHWPLAPPSRSSAPAQQGDRHLPSDGSFRRPVSIREWRGLLAGGEGYTSRQGEPGTVGPPGTREPSPHCSTWLGEAGAAHCAHIPRQLSGNVLGDSREETEQGRSIPAAWARRMKGRRLFRETRRTVAPFRVGTGGERTKWCAG